MAGALPPPHGRGDARPDPGRPRACSAVHHDLFASEARGAGIAAPSTAPSRLLGEKGLVYRRHARAAQGQDRRRLGAGRAAPCSARPQFGDDQDRPIRKSDGSWTYFGADTAYHMQKARGLGRADQHLGRRPYRHGQADPGRGPGAGRPAVRSTSRSSRWSGCCAPASRSRCRSARETSSPSPKWSRRSARTSSASPC